MLRGGGDLATGVAARLWRSGFGLVVAEIAEPLAVRRLVSFAEAVYSGMIEVEDLRAERVPDVDAVKAAIERDVIPVLVDAGAEARTALRPSALVDARMMKVEPDLGIDAAPFVVGVGPGYTVGINVHAVVESNRGHRLGRVYWQGAAEPDTGIPDSVDEYAAARVLRAPNDGIFDSVAKIGTLVSAGDVLATVKDSEITAPFDGALRGLLRSGLPVQAGLKVGDVDPRGDLSMCMQISDKALAVGGGVLEALLSQPEIRAQLAG